MQIVLTEDQELLAKTAADFAAEHSPIKRVRDLRDSNDPLGYSRALWKQMAELGWVGIPFPEAVGGAGMGLAELAVVLEALGRSLVPEPFLSTVLLAGEAISRHGDDAVRAEWLPRIVRGEAVMACAYPETTSRYALSQVATRCEAAGSGFRITGEKSHVLDAAGCDGFLVSARSAGADNDPQGIELFAVSADAPGVEIVGQTRVDHRNCAIVRLQGVEVAGDARVGAPGRGHTVLEDVVDRATVGLCAEMLGGMSRAFEMTLAHLKEREQFGAPIGSFQALKHRAAELFVEIELVRSCVMAAARAVDAEASDARKLVSLAKARCSDAFVLAGNEGVQMFGGVGMTDEYDIGFYLKRARVAEMTFGDAAYHRSRWAQLSGY